MRILSGIDLPFAASCGSMILCDDVYQRLHGEKNQVRFLALATNEDTNWSKLPDIILLNVKKQYDRNDYSTYVSTLSKFVEEQVQDFKPDIIHIQHFGFGMALAFSQISDIPKLAICHGTDVLFSMKDMFHRNNLKRIVASASGLLFPTWSMYRKFLTIASHTNPMNVVNWGIPDNLLIDSKKRYGHSQYPCKLLYAGRLTPNKNVEVIINAVSILQKDVRLTIIGEGEEKQRLVDKVDKLNLSGQIKFSDFMPRDVLWKEFENHDILIIPTKDIEAFCLLAVEAQAHGIPVFHSNVGGLSEIIGESGIIFDPLRADDLANQIRNVFSKPELLREVSEVGALNAGRFPISKTAQQFLDVSTRMLNSLKYRVNC